MNNNLGVILAGGKGSRLKLNNEKIFTKINGKTLINHAISKLKKLNLDINIVTRKDLKLKIKQKKLNSTFSHNRWVQVMQLMFF